MLARSLARAAKSRTSAKKGWNGVFQRNPLNVLKTFSDSGFVAISWAGRRPRNTPDILTNMTTRSSLLSRVCTGSLARSRTLIAAGRQGGRFSSAAAKVAPPSPPPPPQSMAMQFASWYEARLASQPIPTKMVTSGVLYAIGDTTGQAITVARMPPEEVRPSFDLGRFLRATAFGGIFYPPVAHVHYNFLEWLVVKRWAVSTTYMPWAKMVLEQFVYWGWFSNGYYHAVLGALQGMSPEQIYNRVADTLWETMKAQWVFWIPVQLLNFKFVPLRHQVRGLRCRLRPPPTTRPPRRTRAWSEKASARALSPASLTRDAARSTRAFVRSLTSYWWSRAYGRPSSRSPSRRPRLWPWKIRGPTRRDTNTHRDARACRWIARLALLQTLRRSPCPFARVASSRCRRPHIFVQDKLHAAMNTRMNIASHGSEPRERRAKPRLAVNRSWGSSGQRSAVAYAPGCI
jgi:protein Mpv17